MSTMTAEPPKAKEGETLRNEPDRRAEYTGIVKLRIKRKALAAEALVIRREEIKAVRKSRRLELAASLHQHRTHHVRKAARAAHLAHAFLCERPYREVEINAYEPPILGRIADNAFVFGSFESRVAAEKAVAAWLDGEKQDAATRSQR